MEITIQEEGRLPVTKYVQEGESIRIPSLVWHEIKNPGKVPLLFIEVQYGTYLDETLEETHVYNP